MLVELRAVEALHRLVVRAADRAGELRRDVDGAAVAPSFVGGAADVLHTARDLLRRQHGRHPTFAILAGAAPHLGMVAARVYRQRRLPGLGKALDVLEADVLAAKA